MASVKVTNEAGVAELLKAISMAGKEQQMTKQMA